MAILCVTHISPDGDSACFSWLVDRFVSLKTGHVVGHKFINLAAPAPEILAFADYVGDCGGVYAPEKGRFDHHQLPPHQAASTSAARMLYEYLLETGYEIDYLEPLINL